MTREEFTITDADRLVQRFIDQELSAEERVRFISLLGRDGALRRKAIELEELVLDVRRLPKPSLPNGFVARVLERTAAPAPAQAAWWTQIVHTLWTPRHLQWNLASAGALACVALLALAAVLGGRLNPASRQPAAARPATVLVRLVVLQPSANTVQVAGDFNGWNPALTPLEQTSNGAWSVTLPLRPGRYEYMFVVDGNQWIADPFAVELKDDGFGSRNAVLDVRAPARAES